MTCPIWALVTSFLFWGIFCFAAGVSHGVNEYAEQLEDEKEGK